MVQPIINTPPARAPQMLSPHRVLAGLIGVIIAATVGMLALGLYMMNSLSIILSLVGLACFGVLLAVHMRGWRYSPHAVVLAAVLFAIAGNPKDITTQQLSFTVLIPSVLAAMFLPWYWTIGAFVVCVLGIGAQSGFVGPLFRPDAMLLALIIVAGAAAAGAFGRSAQHTAEERADLLVEEKARVETQARELAEANELMNTQLDQQQQLLNLVATLETPAIWIADGVLLVPIVGHVDSRRAQDLTGRLLTDAHRQSARHIILDIAGVALVDTAVAQSLLSMARSLRLLGCHVVLSGISASVALTLTQLGLRMDEIQTVRSPQEALAQFANVQSRASANSRQN